VPELVREIVKGKRRAVTDRGMLRVGQSRGQQSIVQEPALFDFAKRKTDIALSARRR